MVAAARTYGVYPISEHLEQVPFTMPDVEPFAEFARRAGSLPVPHGGGYGDHE